MKHKKKREYLKVRQKDFEATINRVGSPRDKGFNKPGKYSQKETA